MPTTRPSQEPSAKETKNPFLLADTVAATLHEADHSGKGAADNFKEYKEITNKLKGILEDTRQSDGSIDLMATEKLTGSTLELRQMEVLNLNSVLTGIRGALEYNRLKDYHQMRREATTEIVDAESFAANLTGGDEPQFDEVGAMIIPDATLGRGGPRSVLKPADIFLATMKAEHDIGFGPELARRAKSSIFTVEQPIFDEQGRNIYAATFERDHADPDHLREPWWTPLRQTRLQICHLFHTMTTGTDTIRYFKETTHSSAAAEKAEAAAAPESNYELAETTVPVERISHFLPITEEALADGTPRSIVRQYLNYVLPMGVWQRLDKQLMNGNGTSPNIKGLLKQGISKTKYSLKGKAGAGGAVKEKHWNVLLDAIFKLQDWGSNQPFNILGSQMATHILINPALWADTLKTESDSGGYYFGGPQSGMVNTAWGLPVLPTDHLVATNSTNGEANFKYGMVVGDFSPMFSGLWFRHGVETQTGMIADDFQKFKVSMRASVRVAFAVHRGAAFVGLVNELADGGHPTD